MKKKKIKNIYTYRVEYLYTLIYLCVCIIIACDGISSYSNHKHLFHNDHMTSLLLQAYALLNSLPAIYPAAIPSGGAGVMAGALVIYLTKSKGRRVAIINCVIALLVFLPVIGAFLVTCPNPNIAGINTQYANRYCTFNIHCTRM